MATINTPPEVQRMKYLVEFLNYHRFCYYSLSQPQIPDSEYDTLIEELKGWESSLCLTLANSPTQAVGWKVSPGLPQATHETPLLSLDKTKDIRDLLSMVSLQHTNLSLKVDGLTCELVYENGALVRLSTRGDGIVGQDVTHNAPAIAGIPKQIPFLEPLTVVGEVYIRRKDFEEVNEFQSDGEKYKTPRNLASGSLQALDPHKACQRRLRFLGFGVLKGHEGPSKWANLERLANWGIDYVPHMYVHAGTSQETLQSYIEDLQETARTMDIPVDGMVLAYDDYSYSQSLGSTSHHGNDAIAFKFEDEQRETVLRDIEWNTARNGEMVPTAVFEPVELDGTQVTRAALFHPSFIQEKNLRPGCRIRVSKRNQIIPYVEDNLDPDGEVYSFPLMCPSCGEGRRSETSKVDGREITRLFCGNKNCGDRAIKRLVHFVGEKAFDIPGLAEGTLRLLYEHHCVSKPLDIFSLHTRRKTVLSIPGFGAKSYETLLDNIEQRRKISFARFLVSMDIPLVGRTASKTISNYFMDNVSAFEQAVVNRFDFTQLPGIGDTLQDNVYEFFYITEGLDSWRYNMPNWDFWNLLKQQVTFISDAEIQPAAQDGNPFAGRTVVVTGKMKTGPRKEIEQLLASKGAVIAERVTLKTDYLIAGEKPGSKLDKANEYAKPVLTEDEMYTLLNAA